MKKNSIISNYWDLIDYNVHHIQHSELKASLILTAYGLVFGLAYDVSGSLPIPEKYKYLLYNGCYFLRVHPHINFFCI